MTPLEFYLRFFDYLQKNPEIKNSKQPIRFINQEHDFVFNFDSFDETVPNGKEEPTFLIQIKLTLDF
jgi:hypothetical protein